MEELDSDTIFFTSAMLFSGLHAVLAWAAEASPTMSYLTQQERVIKFMLYCRGILPVAIKHRHGLTHRQAASRLARLSLLNEPIATIRENAFPHESGWCNVVRLY
ncbi:hypothetical protein [Pantoea sp. FN0307]|uniref:hypothetical protein n=1 Tax=Pantoea sp. FN0307 TaxID=3418560 RepID=UPI003CF13526